MSDIKTQFTRTKRAPKVALRGQAAVILDHLDANKETAFTIESLTASCKDKIVTRQDPERVVAYYLSIFKKRGLVLATRPEPVIEDESPDTTNVPDEDDRDESDDTDESEDEDENEEVA
jgi:hypothetical protein